MFTIDANGNLIGTIEGTDTIAVRVELTPTQVGQNVSVDVKIIQELPLDHNPSGNSQGFVTVDGSDISINLPIQAKDTDGDFIADSVEQKVEEIQVNAVNKLNRLKAELKDVAESIKEVGNQLEDLPKSLKSKRAGRKPNVKK